MLINKIALERLAVLPYMQNKTTVLHFSVVNMIVAKKATTGDEDWRVRSHITAAGLSALHMAYANITQFAMADDRPWRTPDDETEQTKKRIFESSGLGSTWFKHEQVLRLCGVTNGGFFRAHITTAKSSGRTVDQVGNTLLAEAFDHATDVKQFGTVDAWIEHYPGYVAKMEI